jgi:hypothetical protein
MAQDDQPLGTIPFGGSVTGEGGPGQNMAGEVIELKSLITDYVSLPEDLT